ncbi:FixH family protein [Aeribacillus alveayuensis]|uniref:YtkA-like domain-containing protein n=1 Tax=Aeribacillus alveayuensis TaxID=279215 RepID=A0ABT9VM22_9BACI|nr:hypothetical protein [Bacillus alveayuensis]
MKKFQFLTIVFVFLLAAGCAADSDQTSEEKNDQNEASMEEQPQMLEANIIVPEAISPHEEVTMKVEVTQGDEVVDDASEVMFEIWQDDKENSEMIKAEHEGNGVYSITKQFEQNGIYHVQTHVTARDLHVMPTKQFVVGEVSEE